jgi:antitoxin CcdA
MVLAAMRMKDAHEECAWLRKRGPAGVLGGNEGKVEPEPYNRVRRPTNLSVRADLIAAARAARVNLSALLERALTEELVRLKWRQWREENGPAVAVYNRYVKEHGAFCRIGLRWGCRSSSPFT